MHINSAKVESNVQASDWPKISVVTVFYNPGPLLEKTILSVFEQNYPNLDYVLIDDCSTDGSELVAKKYSDRVRYWRNSSNLGIYGAMNEGIKVADGQWLNFLNSGDIFYSKKVLRNVARQIKLSPQTDFIYGKFRLVDPEDGLQLVKGDKVSRRDWCFRTAICHQTVFARNNLFSEIGPYDATMRITADYDWFVKYFSRQKIHPLFIDDILVDFLLDGASFRHRLVGLRERLGIVKKNYSNFIYALNLLNYIYRKSKMILIYRFYHTRLFKFYRKIKYRNKGL